VGETDGEGEAGGADDGGVLGGVLGGVSPVMASSSVLNVPCGGFTSASPPAPSQRRSGLNSR
jgi:hypothetical protein